MTRQAIFNILGVHVKGVRVCDLYAGGGSLGVEALSRGASEAVFVEKNPVVLRFLRQNVRGLGGAAVIMGDVLKVLARLAEPGFDIILADPPYCNALVQQTLDRVAEHGVLRPGGLLVIEHHKLEQPAAPQGWELLKQGQYGDSWVSVLRRQGG
jgi:16S rRNA (guanine966-N2)-methyltransferase